MTHRHGTGYPRLGRGAAAVAGLDPPDDADALALTFPQARGAREDARERVRWHGAAPGCSAGPRVHGCSEVQRQCVFVGRVELGGAVEPPHPAAGLSAQLAAGANLAARPATAGTCARMQGRERRRLPRTG